MFVCVNLFLNKFYHLRQTWCLLLDFCRRIFRLCIVKFCNYFSFSTDFWIFSYTGSSNIRVNSFTKSSSLCSQKIFVLRCAPIILVNTEPSPHFHFPHSRYAHWISVSVDAVDPFMVLRIYATQKKMLFEICLHRSNFYNAFLKFTFLRSRSITHQQLFSKLCILNFM